MKKLSGTSSPKPPEITFFTDRDLGKGFPRILRESGLNVVRYADHFGELNVPDEEWIAFAARESFVAISHDRNIRSDPVATRSLMENGGRLFILRGKNLSGGEKAELFLKAMGGVLRVLEEQPGAFIAVVSRSTPRHGTERAEVRVRQTYEEWSRGSSAPGTGK